MKTYNFTDATYIVRQKLAEGQQSLDRLLNEWKAPRGSKVEIQDRKIYFTQQALEKLRNSIIPLTEDYSIEQGFQHAMTEGGIFDVLPIVAKDRSGVQVDLSSPPLEKLLAQTSWDQIGYGHTHPRGYGPIFSLSGQPYYRYGKDYNANMTHKNYMGMSGLHLVIAPGENGNDLLGICEAGENGVIKMYPWQVLRVKVVERPTIRIIGPRIKVSQ